MKVVNVDKRFELIGRTGQGSMSKVWRAFDKDLGRTVCLKLLDKEKTKKFEARFVGLKRPPEGEICIDLKHINIVTTFDYGITTVGEPFLVMELVDGHGLNFLVETKHQMLKGNRINLLVQICDGLEHLHKAGYMHRDICPRNIMVTKEKVVKLIDFGLAIPNTPDFCKPGNRTGTPDYLAPEVIKRTNTDLRVDLFALGVTAYELFTFNMPWERGESMKTLQRHLSIAGKDPREHVPELDEKISRFLLKAVERDPAARYQTVAEFRKVLKAMPPC